MATKIPEFGGSARVSAIGFGGELYKLLSSFRDAIELESEEAKADLRASFRKASGYMQKVQFPIPEDFEALIKTLGVVSQAQQVLRMDVQETIAALYNARPESSALIDRALQQALEPALKDADVKVRRAATGSLEKLGASTVSHGYYKREFVKMLKDISSAEQDIEVRRGLAKGMTSIVRAELGVINNGLAALKPPAAT